MNNKSYYTYYPSPMGILKIEFNNQALLKVEFDDHLREVKNNCQENFYQDPKILNIYNLIFDQLNQYFLGTRTKFEIPISLAGSEFDLKVWNYLKEIPYGQTYSYQEVAAALSKPKAAQAVGQANSRNPIAIIIPCHRVIGANGALNGYAGGVWRKKWLLNHENNKSNKLERKISFA
ncbi:methylated-DNA/protein-cysteinemethyltransferase [Halanaerobium praevalens DSM 2228]|uniref:Methylated-DNA--protein-cysteine methyltransferase n=1 Tax=Halanaerobium praevalens (strain ATCC 33744 / DSM 2228 / GSL) TaxID=572479 RepID=E3DS04_HALPG|nr:methylated-DNA/protein-cysteinemethyltransferase [Halanaerobium praevalens DSM 2228]